MLNRTDLHDYQLDTVNFIKDKKRCGLWLDMGMGKTIITLTALVDLLYGFSVGKVLIISPLRVAKSVWEQEARNWSHTRELSFSICCGTQTQRLTALGVESDIHVINNDNIKWLVDTLGDKWNFDCVVVDESSCFKNPSSKRFKALKKILGKTTHMILLTGTPAPNSHLDLWSQTYLIDKGERLQKTMTSYKSCYFEADYSGYKYTVKEGSRRVINDKLRDVYKSLKLSDYFPGIRGQYVIEPVQLNADEMCLYFDFKKHFCAQINRVDLTCAVSASVLSGKLLQLANGAAYNNFDRVNWCTYWGLISYHNYVEKSFTTLFMTIREKYKVFHDEKLKRLKEIVDDNLNENFLVAYNFKSDKERLLKAFPYAKTLDDENVFDDWNAGKVKMLIAHPASAGHGLNLQKGGRVVIWFGLCWSLELYKQFNARLMRQGQDEVVKIIHLVANNTIDERVVEVLMDKDANQSKLLEALKEHHVKQLDRGDLDTGQRGGRTSNFQLLAYSSV